MFKKINILMICSVFLGSNVTLAFTGIKEFETTRLKALGGAGVASILMNEATVLNPAAVVFLNNSGFYYQKDSDELDEKSLNRTNNYKEAFSESIIITDTSSSLKGGLGYQYQNENAGKRKRIAASMASNVGKRSSLGFTFRHNEERSNLLNKTYSQLVIGFTHIVKEGLNIGFTVIDPTQSVEEYFKYTGGLQFTVYDNIDIIADIGSGDVANSEKESFTKLAVQLKSFDQLFIRYGRFNDELYNEKGHSLGFSWVGPKLSLDFAQKTFEPIDNSTDNILIDEQIIETSFGITLLI